MSLSLTVTQAVDRAVQTYISRIATQYNLNKSDLMCLWSGEEVLSTPSVEPSDNPQLLKLGKPELMELCKAKGLKSTGTKVVLISRLSGKEETVAVPQTLKKVVAVTPVAKKLTSKIPTVPIRRNQFGNYEHPETSFIFNPQNQKVIGKQNDDGKVEDLTEADIDICNKFKFPYEMPEDLDKKSTLVDVQVEELDDEDSSEEYEEELSEEELSEEEEVYEDDD